MTNACMSSWVFTDRHVPSEHRQLDAVVPPFFDVDDLSGDDTLDVMEPGQTPRMRFDWPTGTVSVLDARDSRLVPALWPIDYAVATNDPVRWCSRNEPIKICVELRFDEAP